MKRFVLTLALLVGLVPAGAQAAQFASIARPAFASAGPGLDIGVCLCLNPITFFLCPCPSIAPQPQGGGQNNDSFFPGGAGKNTGVPGPSQGNSSPAPTGSSMPGKLGPDGNVYPPDVAESLWEQYRQDQDRRRVKTDALVDYNRKQVQEVNLYRESQVRAWSQDELELSRRRQQLRDQLQSATQDAYPPRASYAERRNLAAEAVRAEIRDIEATTPPEVPRVPDKPSPLLALQQESHFQALTPVGTPEYAALSETAAVEQEALRFAQNAATFSDERVAYVQMASFARVSADTLYANADMEEGDNMLRGANALLNDVFVFDTIRDTITQGSMFFNGVFNGLSGLGVGALEGYEETYAAGELLGSVLGAGVDAAAIVDAAGAAVLSDALAVGTGGALAPVAVATHVAAVAEVTAASASASVHFDRFKHALNTLREGDGARGSNGWKVGDDVYKETRAGKEPAWSTVRARFWKNEAELGALKGEYPRDSANMERMKRGLAPKRYSPEKGGWESMELSHEPVPKRQGGKEFKARWPQDHADVDPFRRPGY